MGYLAIQMFMLLGFAVIGGVLAGWWVTQFIYRQATAECRTELAGLRRNYADSSLENVSLRSKVRQLDSVLRKISTPPSDADYGDFLQLRKALEKTRLQYQSLLDKFYQQQKTLSKLRAEFQSNKQELLALQAALADKPLAATAEVCSIPVGSGDAVTAFMALDASKRDDLTLIQGINQRLASKLQALGIVSYRQVAEFTSDDVHHIQRMIGSDIHSPPEGWVQNARLLFQQKNQTLQA